MENLVDKIQEGNTLSVLEEVDCESGNKCSFRVELNEEFGHGMQQIHGGGMQDVILERDILNEQFEVRSFNSYDIGNYQNKRKREKVMDKVEELIKGSDCIVKNDGESDVQLECNQKDQIKFKDLDDFKDMAMFVENFLEDEINNLPFDNFTDFVNEVEEEDEEEEE